jgi:hypothetical protein
MTSAASKPPTRGELEAAFCWEADDTIPRRPEMSAFRRKARYHQAQLLRERYLFD